MGKKDTRLNALIHTLRNNGAMRVSELSQHLNVSAMTIRRDLDELQNNGLVSRSYGRAELSSSTVNVQYENIESVYSLHSESEKMFEEKRRIGKFAADMLEGGEVIIIDNGSTTNHFADFIPDSKELTIVCYNLNIVQKLWRMEHVHILPKIPKSVTRDWRRI